MTVHVPQPETSTVRLSLNKAARTRLAGEVVETLEKVARPLEDYFNTTNLPLFRREIDGIIEPDGSSSAHIVQIPARFAAGSNHENMKAYTLETNLHDTFAVAAQKLAQLFPGQFLHWTFNNEVPARHTLSIGDVHKNRTKLIDTVLTRWKAPLVRLSMYFEEIEVSGQLSTYLLAATPPVPGHNKTLGMPHTRIDARSLDEAYRLVGFNKQSGTVLTPGECSNLYAHRLADPITHADFEAHMARKAAETHPVLNQALTDLSRDTDDLADKVVRSMFDLSMLGAIKVSIDLLTGDFEFRTKPTCSVHPRDRTDIDAREAKAKTDLSVFLARFTQILRDVHPTIYEGSAKIRVDARREDERFGVYLTGMIDGLYVHHEITGLGKLLEKASDLANTTQQEPLCLFGSVETSEMRSQTVNGAGMLRCVEATSHEHAAYLLGHEFQSGNTLYRVNPETVAEITYARSRRAEAIKRAYPQKS